MSTVKTVAKKIYRGSLFILLLAIMLLCMVLLLAFIANPTAMLEAIQSIFGIN